MRALIAALLTLTITPAHAQHALSLHGTPKYPPSFSHFSYVNLDAPRGGSLTIAVRSRFDSFNNFIVRGTPAPLLTLLYDTLMTPSEDEPSSLYPLLATHVDITPTAITFTLNPNARFHDNTPVTAHDVAWSLTKLKELHPHYRTYYEDVSEVKVLSPQQVQFVNANPRNRELPYILGEVPVLPRHYWQTRDISKTTLTPPIGSGPYRINSFSAGSSITYSRNENYWARDLPANRGRWNFKTLRAVVYLDENAVFEAFKSGNVDFRSEYSAQRWATGYNFPAARRDEVIRSKIPKVNPAPMQGFILNHRRPFFTDPRVRQAFNLAYDFEWANKTLFYQQYTRLRSYFAGSDLAATTLPSPDEYKLLEPLANQLPPHTLTRIYTNPEANNPQEKRSNLRRARTLLEEAGWKVRNGTLTHLATNTPLHPTFLLVQPSMERVSLPYINDLRKLGIEASIQVVDPSRYRALLENYDYDIIVGSFPQSLSPGNEQRNFWSSSAADRPGSYNFLGIRSPAVDALVEHVIDAPNRQALITATRALDRTLLWGHHLVPHWYSPFQNIAYHNHLQHPSPLPAHRIGLISVWWSTR